MVTFIRLYRFHRRCGMTVSRSAKRALATVLHDMNLTNGGR